MSTPQEYRSAMSRLAGGICVVTARDGRSRDVAAVVTSVASVSLEPPRLLVVVHLDSRLSHPLRLGQTWAITVAASASAGAIAWLSEPGRPDLGQLTGIASRRGEESGAPLLTEGAAWLECRTAAVHPSGEHLIVVGDVLTASSGEPDAGALVHRLGRVRHLT